MARTDYRGRLAPSPTGYLHLGHARTFWTTYARARAHRGTLVLRNEDLDPQRSRAEYVTAMLEDLRWLGIEWQEGPDVGGPYAPYEQSRRRAHYLAAWRVLLARGFIYPCTCTRRDLARIAQAPHETDAPHETSAPHAPDDEPFYPGTCRPSHGAHVARTDDPRGINWRFRIPDGETIAFDDLHEGPQAFVAARDFGDFLIWRRDDVPAYQLACVVDDQAMQITEVVRGADLLKSTARQLLIIRALDYAAPRYYHCPLVTDERGARLAKRHDALSLRHLRAAGATPEQLRASFDARTTS